MKKQKLKGLMRELDITVIQAAAACGISVGAMSNKLNGKSDFTVNEMLIMMDLCQLTLEDIREYWGDE